MKTTLLILIGIVLSIPVFTQVTINWTDPVDVATSAYGNDYPRIVLNGESKPMVSWGGGNKVYFSKLSSSGFSEPLQLNNDTTDAYTAFWTGPDLIARNDTVYAAFMHQDWGKKTYIVRSFDNGDTFGEPRLIENYSDSTSRFPMVAMDQNGNPFVGIMKMTLNGAHPHYVVRRSFDYGSTFTDESNVGGWSGAESEACDCCPGAIKAEDGKVVVFYRDNLNNIRDIWATVSTDGGSTFTQGFAVDNNQWEIFACPSSGPDGVIIGDSLYTVFLSGNACYLSKSSISAGAMVSIIKLGDLPVSGSQNFPRIDHYNNQVAITWRGSGSGTKLYLSYTDDITNGLPFIQDTIYHSSLTTADVVIGEDGIHVVIEDLDDGNVKYIHGAFSTTTSLDDLYQSNVSLFPNPVSDILNIKGYKYFERFNVYSSDGRLVLSGKIKETLDISSLDSGTYIFELLDAQKNNYREIILKN